MPINQTGYSATQHLEDFPHLGLNPDQFWGWADGRKVITPHIVAKYQDSGINPGTRTIVKPQHVKRGTLAIMVGAIRSVNAVFTVPTGWTELYPQQAGTDTSPGLCLQYRVLTEDDDAVTSWSWTYAAGSDTNKIVHVVFVEGADPYAPFASYNYVYNTATVSSIPDFHVPMNDCLVLCFAACSTSNNSLTPVITFGSPFTKDMSELLVGTNRQSISHAYYYPSASSESSRSDFLGWTTGATISATNENPEAVHVVVVQPLLYSV